MKRGPDFLVNIMVRVAIIDQNLFRPLEFDIRVTGFALDVSKSCSGGRIKCILMR